MIIYLEKSSAFIYKYCIRSIWRAFLTLRFTHARARARARTHTHTHTRTARTHAYTQIYMANYCVVYLRIRFGHFALTVMHNFALWHFAVLSIYSVFLWTNNDGKTRRNKVTQLPEQIRQQFTLPVDDTGCRSWSDNGSVLRLWGWNFNPERHTLHRLVHCKQLFITVYMFWNVGVLKYMFQKLSRRTTGDSSKIKYIWVKQPAVISWEFQRFSF